MKNEKVKVKPYREFFLTAEEARQIANYILQHPNRDFYIEETNDPPSPISMEIYISVYGDGLSSRSLAKFSSERVHIKDPNSWMLC